MDRLKNPWGVGHTEKRPQSRTEVGRTQAIEVRDLLRPDVVLYRRTVEDFVDGEYVVWKIRSPVRFRVRRTGPRHAVVSGIFFDPAAKPRPSGNGP